MEMFAIAKFKDIGIKKRRHCVICGTPFDAPLIKLPKLPLTEIYVAKRIEDKGIGFIDQEFHLCENCGHGQIANAIDTNILYGSSYRAKTSPSPSAAGSADTFLAFIENVMKGRAVKTILEIGCNDLYLLNKLRDKASHLYGIDPILKGQEGLFQNGKIKIIGDFFENVNFKKLGIRPDVVLSSHTLEHIADPKKLIQELIDNSPPDALFFFQFPGLEALVRSCRFDQIFHQHLNYFSARSVLRLLNKAGARLIDFKINPYHWGSLMIAFKKKINKRDAASVKFHSSKEAISGGFIQRQYAIFKDCMDITSRRMRSLRNEAIYGYGAALMLPVLDYHLGGGLNALRFIIDDDKNKEGLYYLNLPVKITSPERVNDLRDSVVLVTAVNSLYSTRAIINKLIDLKVRQILIPANLI